MRTKLARARLDAGDAIVVASPGGGGFGDPLERDVEAVERDLNLGYISREAAERDFAVVIADVRMVAGRPRYRLDHERTREERTRRGGPVAVGAADTTRGGADV
jgi:N-methylhydantoinase B